MDVSTVVDGAVALETLGIVGVLGLVIAALVYVIRKVYNNERLCQAERLVDAEHRTTLSGELGQLKGEMVGLQTLHQSHLMNMVQGQSNAATINRHINDSVPRTDPTVSDTNR